MKNKNLKSEIARTLAWLLTEPDQEMVEALETGDVHRLLSSYFMSVNGERPSLAGFLPEKDRGGLPQQMREEYRRLFQDPEAKEMWWVESVHKPWTSDPDCKLIMTGKKGYLMGDPALHMMGLYHSLGVSVPEGFTGVPDHIVLELELLAFLIENHSEDAVKMFRRDHLDWVEEMVTRGKTFQPSPFYISVFEALGAFIKLEKVIEDREAPVYA